MGAKMIVLYAHWCSKCNMMMAIVDEVENYYGEKLQVIRIDIEENPDAMTKYSAEIVPTFILYQSDSEIGRMAGMIGEKVFYQRIETLFL